MAIARCNLPAVHLPGGTQLNAPDYVTSDEMWPMGAAVRRGELDEDGLELAQRGACPTCGACPENVVITPHAAYYPEEAVRTVRTFAAQEVVRVLTGQPQVSPVNAGALVEARWSRSSGPGP